jgi:hypothetical protein
LPANRVDYLTGRSFFPHLISGPFASGLSEAFTFAVVACLIAAGASWLRGGKYHHGDETETGPHEPVVETAPATGRVKVVDARAPAARMAEQVETRLRA